MKLFVSPLASVAERVDDAWRFHGFGGTRRHGRLSAISQVRLCQPLAGA